MEYLVLGIGYSQSEYEFEKGKWAEYGITFDFVDDIVQAARRLTCKEYVCVVICTDAIPDSDLFSLRTIRPIPILVVPPSYSADQRYTCVHFSAMQYLHAAGPPSAAGLGTTDSMRYYLDIPFPDRKPLTIITVQDLCFCLEYRSVEVRQQEIDLTAKEFDILALLIMNQRRVFTYEMIMELVWKEDLDNYSRKAIVNHVSNLRKKLRIAPDVPDYIKSVHSIGYKFDVK